MLNKLKNQKINKKPFSYILIENFLSEEDYDELLNNIPDISEYNKFTETRYYITDQEKIESHKILKKMKDFFNKKEIINILLKKFQSSIKIHMNNEINLEEENIKAYLSIQKMTSNYSINIHTDGGYQIFNILYYINKPTDKDWYLNLYELKDNLNFEGKYYRYLKNDETILKKKIQSSGNKIFIYLDTPLAYHSASNNNKKIDFIRNTICISYFTENAKKPGGKSEDKERLWKYKRIERQDLSTKFTKYHKDFKL